MRNIPTKPRRGFLLLDATTAIILATALLIAFTIAIGKFHRGERQLADQRAAARRLEDSLIALQNGGKPEPDLAVERLPGSVKGATWVRISTPAGQPKVSLVGLVPDDRLPGGTP